MRDDERECALPGMEELVRKVGARPGEEDLSDEKKYTGEVLFRDHPEVFQAVAASFFIDRLSIRSTAARFRVSVNTVRAIRDMAVMSATTDAGRAAFFIKSKADSLIKLINYRALEAIHDRLADPEQARQIPVDTLIELAQAQTQPKNNSVYEISSPQDTESFDDLINGLNQKKKSAAEVVDVVADDQDEKKNDRCDEQVCETVKDDCDARSEDNNAGSSSVLESDEE